MLNLVSQQYIWHDQLCTIDGLLLMVWMMLPPGGNHVGVNASDGEGEVDLVGINANEGGGDRATSLMRFGPTMRATRAEPQI